jgi:phosphoglycerate dehydrogenase-like enzyme
MTIRVLVTGEIPAAVLRAIKEASPRLEILTDDDRKRDPACLEEIEVLYGGLSREELARARRLRWWQTSGAGVNGLLTPDLIRASLRVTNASGIHAEPITEHFFGMLLALIRRLPLAWEQQREQRWDRALSGPGLGMIAGKTLGLLGVGAIGSQAAKVGAAFGMRPIGLRRNPAPVPYVEQIYGPEELEPFLGETDVLFNSLPLTPKTRRILDARSLAWLKPGAILANVGRGATIDTEALVAALAAGRLGGALLDVTDPEPLPAGHPLFDRENVLITPHYAGSHPGYEERAARVFLENLRRYLDGEPLINEVDKEAGY